MEKATASSRVQVPERKVGETFHIAAAGTQHRTLPDYKDQRVNEPWMTPQKQAP